MAAHAIHLLDPHQIAAVGALAEREGPQASQPGLDSKPSQSVSEEGLEAVSACRRGIIRFGALTDLSGAPGLRLHGDNRQFQRALMGNNSMVSRSTQAKVRAGLLNYSSAPMSTGTPPLNFAFCIYSSQDTGRLVGKYSPVDFFIRIENRLNFENQPYKVSRSQGG